ncbi:MAG: SMI1/KNR4 family protein [Acidobacteriota bacterium]|nr:SMI1/KNR4 family protein [Acidobacteriota bacterium]
MQNNGLGVEAVTIFPVFDERDARKTWDSIARNYKENWLENFKDEQISFEHLLPFAEFGTGDFYCFDYSKSYLNGEISVVHWSHETGETEICGKNFEDFLEKLKSGKFDFD